ncbi:MAG: hypothetical protein IJL92_09445 [Thermoguttaceae bacterium]|nr:hypothetical protein [Thermoguttaceae bacterium]
MKAIEREIGVVNCGRISVAPPEKNRLEPWDYGKESYKQCSEPGRFFED